LANISAADPNAARWNLTVESGVYETGDPSIGRPLPISGFMDSNGVWAGADLITLTPNCTLQDTTIINTNRLISHSGFNGKGAAFNGMTVLTAPKASNASFMQVSNLDELDGCLFVSDGTGHAVELISLLPGSMTWNSTDIGYAATSGSTGNETIFVNVATGGMTINVTAGATTPSIRTAGAFINLVVAPAVTTITVQDTLGSVIENARVYLIAETGGPLAAGTVIFNTLTNVDGEVTDSRELASDQPVSGWVRRGTSSPLYRQSIISATIDSVTGLTLTVVMVLDE
jgi:hypothetical protein